MNSPKKTIGIVSRIYQQQKLPDSLGEEVKERLIIEEQRFSKKQKKKKIAIFTMPILLPIMALYLSLLFIPGFQAFAQEIPILGTVVKVMTGEVFKDQSEHINIDVPEIKEKNKTAETLNKKYLAEGKAQYDQLVKNLGDIKDGHWEAGGTYEKLVDDDRFLVIKRQLTVTAADTQVENSFDTVDKKAGVVLTLPMLFKDDSYLEVIAKEIQAQIDAQMKDSENNIYWTEKDVKEGMIEPVQLMKPDRDFYINKQHQLVISFPRFEIAPGYMGAPEFVIPTEKIKGLLVDPTYLK
jgi:hypothetical protein